MKRNLNTLYFIVVLILLTVFPFCYGLTQNESVFIKKMVDLNPILQQLSIPTDDSICNFELGTKFFRIHCTVSGSIYYMYEN